MEMDDRVVLNLYELAMTVDQQQQQSSVVSFFSKILPQAGLGAYHTSLDVNGYCYSYGVGGISKTSTINKHKYLPANATFLESITLGSLNLGNDLSIINKCINNLRRTSFTETGYHVLHRNCNHFTETFATALIIANDLICEKPPELKSYPKWINRLARTSSNFTNRGPKDSDVNGMAPALVCNVRSEAILATGLDDQIGWDLKSPSTAKTSATKNWIHSKKDSKSRNKKELTEAQKTMLAKLSSKK
jgi:hypothetical protein